MLKRLIRQTLPTLKSPPNFERMEQMKIIFLALLTLISTISCKEEAEKVVDAATVKQETSTLTLTLSPSNTPLDSDPNPIFKMSGLLVHNGTVQLFSDPTCTAAASGRVNVSGGTASITANSLTGSNHRFWVQHTDAGNNVGDCIGPVEYSMEVLTLALSSSSIGWGSDDTPDFSVTGLVVQNGTGVRLFDRNPYS